MRHPSGLPQSLRAIDHTLVMGVLNVTPDSFSDGGLFLDHDAAVAHGLSLVAEGADLIDVGGESTRPGAQPVALDEEHRRVVAVVRDLAAEGVAVSIDTRHAAVARACVEAGAVLVNDVSGGRADPAMWSFVAESRVPYVLMHNRGDGASRDDLAEYADAVRDVWDELDVRVAEAFDAGVEADQLVVDPGFGFAKRPTDNWELLDALATMGTDEHPWPAHVQNAAAVMVGVSRKRFLSTERDGSPRSSDSMQLRDALTVDITREVAQAGVWCVRVHDVSPNVEAVRSIAPIGGGIA